MYCKRKIKSNFTAREKSSLVLLQERAHTSGEKQNTGENSIGPGDTENIITSFVF